MPPQLTYIPYWVFHTVLMQWYIPVIRVFTSSQLIFITVEEDVREYEQGINLLFLTSFLQLPENSHENPRRISVECAIKNRQVHKITRERSNIIVEPPSRTIKISKRPSQNSWSVEIALKWETFRHSLGWDEDEFWRFISQYIVKQFHSQQIHIHRYCLFFFKFCLCNLLFASLLPLLWLSVTSTSWRHGVSWTSAKTSLRFLIFSSCQLFPDIWISLFYIYIYIFIYFFFLLPECQVIDCFAPKRALNTSWMIPS